MGRVLMVLGKIPLRTCRPSNRCSFSSDPQSLESISCPRIHLRRVVKNKLLFKEVVFPGQSFSCYRLRQVSSFSSEDAHPISEEPVKWRRSKDFEQWDSMTAKLAGAANLPFLLLQLPQIVLNTRNLLEGNTSALLAVPWLGMLTGLLGNLCLASYFIKKRETEATVVQTLGVISTYVVMLQLAMGKAMPLPQFIVTSVVVASGLIINFTQYFNLLHPSIWSFWEDFMTIAGVSTLLQVMWSTFIPYVPNTILPGISAFATAVTAVLMWTNLLNPENIKGLSAVTMLLAMIGNGLMIPRALFIRDLMWFTGSAWGSIFYGWGNLICLYCLNSISREFFFASTFGFLVWIGVTFWRDAQAHGLSSPLTSLKELVFGP
ncbi:hypothetical protein ACS0TY_036732 [Phlomoides rotata]